MVITNDTHPPEKNLIQMVSLIVILVIVILYSDISTPLGLMTWILYFIPLFLTLYLRWEYGSFAVSGAVILCIGISYFLSPRDMSEIFALANRLFFFLILIISAILIWNYKKQELLWERAEERYQSMIESSPEIIIIVKDGIIQYVNPAGVEICETDGGLKPGRDCMVLFDPEDHRLIESNIEKASQGAKMELFDITIRCRSNIIHRADIWIGEILWDKNPAIQMIIKKKYI